MRLLDVHLHLDHPLFDKDRDDVVKRAVDSGVKVMVTNGINPRTNRISLKYGEVYDEVKVALGIYPTEVLVAEVEEGSQREVVEKFDEDEEIAFIESQKDKIVAVGECGMDFYWIQEGKDKQRVLFQKMIDLAKRIEKPIIVHTRKAELECVEMLEKNEMNKVLLHCFGGRLHLAKRAADNGWYLSIPPSIVRSSHFQRIVEEVNVSNLLTETDAPYLAPGKDQRNEPTFVSETVKKIAEIKKMDANEVADIIFMNYQRLFL
ncbi:TatD family hydrolase [Candidatus Woesearchaeota archaeon]|jgi:TatD DNase family protein|nr:TatD family hydrolase [Candidatus Woesearchaeota archaeon]MBT3537162.1 TatD family hydrolase [Candidatus Woesearchaeota archaeon]MBT4717508.1 TatD family hydrolase [Candidatus Woesearchaeota archaeon]MBT7106528.1 TatD family hydrolase [Candidatus Woesearchaeota archaeon]MBT7931097.1 TatD family hydrolase [Candidatus Woesearchaeota archaeon]